MSRSFIDLHCHTSASFDSLSDPAKVVRAAVERGITHLIVTDHDRIDGALRARDKAPSGLTVIIGEEVRTSDGDLIAAYIDSPLQPGRGAAETAAAIRAQGGLVGIPHPFDRFRGSLSREIELATMAPLVDWVEIHNARLIGGGNERAALFARDHGIAGVAVSDAHSILEVAVAYTAVDGDPSTADGLMAALPGAEIVPGRASFAARLWTPIAKTVQRARGNRRIPIVLS